MLISKIVEFWHANISRKLDTYNLISISREAILHNYDLFQSIQPNSNIWPVLKSNAYGHGITQVAGILKARQFEYLVVDSYYEALEVWKVSTQKVLLIGISPIQNLKYFNYSKTALVVYNINILKELGRLRRRIKIHLKINTGLNRQGIKPSQVDTFLTELKKFPLIQLEGVCSHLAVSDDDLQDDYTKTQEYIFLHTLEQIHNAGFFPKFVHLSNTSGTTKINNDICNTVRLGIGLYGFNPKINNSQALDSFQELKPALCFTSKVINTINLEPGDRVSYGASFVADKKMKVGLLPIGYYEVFTRSMSNKAVVSYKNRFLPLVGNICMNLCVFSCEDENIEIGDEIEIISNQPGDKNSIYALADLNNTIPYEILVNLAEPIRRKIV